MCVCVAGGGEGEGVPHNKQKCLRVGWNFVYHLVQLSAYGFLYKRQTNFFSRTITRG